jgi:6-bladed beta-propeller
MKHTIFFVTLFWLIACNPHQNEKITPSLIRLSDRSSQSEVAIDPWIATLKLVTLKSDSLSMIANIERVYHRKDRIYILDRKISKSIYIFDTAGNFIYRIKSHARVPERIGEIQDMTLTDEGFTVLQKLNRELLEYDKDGQLLSRRIFPEFPASGIFFSDNRYLFYNFYNPTAYGSYKIMNTGRFSLYDSKAYMPFNAKENGTDLLLTEPAFHPAADSYQTLFHEYFNDTIFASNGGDFQPKYIFQFSDHPLPPDFLLARYEEPRALKAFRQGLAFLSDQVMEIDSLLIFQYQSGSKLRLGIYDTKHDILQMNAASLYSSGLKHFFPLQWFRGDDNHLLTFYYPEQLQIKTANPVIVMFTLKNQVNEKI